MPITLADLPELIHYPVQCLGTACDRSSFIRKREVVYHSLISRLPITPLSPRVFGAHLCSVVFPLWGICTHIMSARGWPGNLFLGVPPPPSEIQEICVLCMILNHFKFNGNARVFVKSRFQQLLEFSYYTSKLQLHIM